jgi:tetratricopeptide (TPR) repeat protein
MRNAGLLMIAALLLALPATGCRLPGREGPVSQSVSDCRRLAQQGVAAMERGQQLKAEALLGQAVTACPVDPEARRNYAESLWRRGARQQAIMQMEEASRLAGEDAALWARLAEMHLAEGKVELARQFAEKAIDLDSKLAAAWAVRGGVMRAAGQPQQALSDCLRALSYSPKDRRILLEVAELYQQQQQPERALQTLQSVAETYSPGEEPEQVLYAMGRAYVALGRFEDGVESLSAAVIRGNATPEMFYHLGEAELLAGRPGAAAAAARQALSLQPQHQGARELLDRLELAQRPQDTPRR